MSAPRTQPSSPQKISATSASEYIAPTPNEARTRTSPIPVKVTEKCEVYLKNCVSRNICGPKIREELHAWFPSTEGKDDYYRWMYRRHEQTMKLCNTPASPEEFVAHVDGMDFRNPQHAEKLVDWQVRDVRPWLPLGRTTAGEDSDAYRLLPGAYGLLPHNHFFSHESAADELLPPCFLGVDFAVQLREPAHPATRRAAESSSSSSLSEEKEKEKEEYDDDERFACARIGDFLGEMGFGRELVWSERVGEPVELVRVVRGGDGRLERVAVGEVVGP